MKNLIRTIVILLFGVIGWAACGVVFYVSEIIFKTYLAILIHFILAPVIFAILSYLYFKYFNLTSSLKTAVVVTGIVITLDFFIVALLIEKNFQMFSSVMGTWLPFGFIFITIFTTGLNFNDNTLG
jgi:hypothetical protein